MLTIFSPNVRTLSHSNPPTPCFKKKKKEKKRNKTLLHKKTDPKLFCIKTDPFYFLADMVMVINVTSALINGSNEPSLYY